MNSKNINEYSQAAREALFGNVVSDANEYIVRRMTWTDPATSTTTYVSGPTLVPSLATSGPTQYTLSTSIDFPRLITIQGSASPLTGTIVLGGTDILGNSITESLSLSHLDVVASTKAFSSVAYISLPTANQTGDVVVGISAKLGLDRVADDNATILGLVDGTRESTAPVITGDTDVAKNVVSFSTAPNGSRDLTLYYIARDL